MIFTIRSVVQVGQVNSKRLGGHCFDCCVIRASRQENFDEFVYDVTWATVQISRFLTVLTGDTNTEDGRIWEIGGTLAPQRKCENLGKNRNYVAIGTAVKIGTTHRAEKR
jgi:hypothetical protein